MITTGTVIGCIFIGAYLGLIIWVVALDRKVASYRRAHARYRAMLAAANFHLANPKKWHDLKCHPPYFDQVYRGLKPFDVRVNDRDFVPGDGLRLREYLPTQDKFTGRTACVYVMAVYLDLPGVKVGHCAMSIRVIAPPLE
jgi:hypothetical protein